MRMKAIAEEEIGKEIQAELPARVDGFRVVEAGLRTEEGTLVFYLPTRRMSDFLEAVNSQGYDVWCLSNDISEWSKKLRARFGLDRYIRGFVISGDAGVRKPEQAKV